MKDWKDIPEYNQIWKKIFEGAKYYDDTYDERQKKQKFDVDLEYRKFHLETRKWLADFQNDYRKKHPEEFDENGNFKV